MATGEKGGRNGIFGTVGLLRDIRDSHLFTSWLSSLFKVCSPSCVCAWLGRRQALAVDPPAPRGAVASQTRASCHSPRLGRGEMVQSHPLSFNPRQSPGLSVGLRPMTNACRPQSSHRMEKSRKAARALKAAAVRIQAHRSPRRWRKWDSTASTNTRTG